MKTRKYSSALLVFILMFTLSTASLGEDVYGAMRLQEETTYPLREVLRAMMEETGLRLQWLFQVAERFPEEPLFTQALEMEQTRMQSMLQQFSAWGFDEETAEPPHHPEIPAKHEQALKALRDMAQLGMLMSMRLEVNRDLPDGEKFWAHSWGHEYRQQLDDCDLKADMLGYSWAWQYEEDEPQQEQNREQNHGINSPQGETEPAQEQNREQNHGINGPQGETEPAQEQNREQSHGMNGPQGEIESAQEQNQEQNHEMNGH